MGHRGPMTALRTRLLGAVRRRVRGLHRDEGAQVMPLVMAFGIAFFSGVVLVMNTGRTVNNRIESQNAVDAAMISGTTSLARGLNYLSKNNVSMAKVLASIAIVRAVPPAAQAGLTTLKVWDGVARGMKITGSALEKFPPTTAAGVALKIASAALKYKVKQEEIVLKNVKSAFEKIRDKWAGDTEDKGLGWTILKGLSKLGDWIANSAPLVAQYSARVVFHYNIKQGKITDLGGAVADPTFSQPNVWMLPLYPSLPVCKGKFGDFKNSTIHFAGKYSKPITTLGWALLTLSLFPMHYERSLSAQIKRLFLGGGADALPDENPNTQEITDLRTANERLKEEAERLQTEKNNLTAERTGLTTERGKKVAERDQAVRDGDNDKKVAADKRIGEIDKRLGEITKRIGEIDDRMEEISDEIEDNNDRITEILDEQGVPSGEIDSDNPPTPEGEGPGVNIGDPVGNGSVRSDVPAQPYLMKETADPDYKKTITYFTLGWRKIEEPFLQGKFRLFRKDTIVSLFSKRMELGFVYASAELYNPTSADTWTPDWRAQLVRTQVSRMPQPLGTTVKACASLDSNQPESSSSTNEEGRDWQAYLEDLVNLVGKH